MIDVKVNTKYGQITAEQYNKYKKSLINRIWAILPMKEENNETLNQYIESLNSELMMNISVFEKSEHIITVVCLLEHVMLETEHDVYRKEILRCCNILSRLGDLNV